MLDDDGPAVAHRVAHGSRSSPVLTTQGSRTAPDGPNGPGINNRAVGYDWNRCPGGNCHINGWVNGGFTIGSQRRSIEVLGESMTGKRFPFRPHRLHAGPCVRPDHTVLRQPLIPLEE